MIDFSRFVWLHSERRTSYSSHTLTKHRERDGEERRNEAFTEEIPDVSFPSTAEERDISGVLLQAEGKSLLQGVDQALFPAQHGSEKSALKTRRPSAEKVNRQATHFLFRFIEVFDQLIDRTAEKLVDVIGLVMRGSL